jgi:hypothetical protein
MFLYTVLISRSIDASTRARDPNNDFFFIFAPQWVTEEKKLNSHPIKQYIDYCSYFKKKTLVHNDACKSCSEFEEINFGKLKGLKDVIRQTIKNIAGPRRLQFICRGTEHEDAIVVNHETHQVKARRCYRASGSILRACLQIYAINVRTWAARKLHELESHLPHPGCKARDLHNSDQRTLAPAWEQSTILTKMRCCIHRSTLARY